MPPTPKPAPAAPAKKSSDQFVAPKPPSIVSWRSAPGGAATPAVVTQIGRHAISVMLFPPESRVGIPKDGVRFIDDPWNKTQGINSESGVWDYTDETKLIRILAAKLIPDLDGNARLLPDDAAAVCASYLR